MLFGCEGRTFGVPLDRLRGIVAALPLTRLPGCGAEVAGLIGLRGRVVTVFDLGVILASRPATTFPDHRLFLVEKGDRLVGCAVDEVMAVAAVRIRPAATGTEVLAGVDPEGPHVVGTGVHEGRRFVAVDLDVVIDQHMA